MGDTYSDLMRKTRRALLSDALRSLWQMDTKIETLLNKVGVLMAEFDDLKQAVTDVEASNVALVGRVQAFEDKEAADNKALTEQVAALTAEIAGLNAGGGLSAADATALAVRLEAVSAGLAAVNAPTSA